MEKKTARILLGILGAIVYVSMFWGLPIPGSDGYFITVGIVHAFVFGSIGIAALIWWLIIRAFDL